MSPQRTGHANALPEPPQTQEETQVNLSSGQWWWGLAPVCCLAHLTLSRVSFAHRVTLGGERALAL